MFLKNCDAFYFAKSKLLFTKEYLQPSQISMMELLCKNSSWFSTISTAQKMKFSIKDFCLLYRSVFFQFNIIYYQEQMLWGMVSFEIGQMMRKFCCHEILIC